jgi:hypothetical protein
MTRSDRSQMTPMLQRVGRILVLNHNAGHDEWGLSDARASPSDAGEVGLLGPDDGV